MESERFEKEIKIMKNEVNEILEGDVVNELGNVNPKPSKVAIFGIVAATAGLFVVFRKKIRTKMEKRMVKKLTKKGYTICEPILEEKDFDEILEPIEK
jgi:hypothetical protein